MLPLLKNGDFIKYKVGKKWLESKVFNSNPSTVWVEDGRGRLLKLHKKIHLVEIASANEEKGGKPQKHIGDLIKGLRVSA
jgi:hypothetical protein